VLPALPAGRPSRLLSRRGASSRQHCIHSKAGSARALRRARESAPAARLSCRGAQARRGRKRKACPHDAQPPRSAPGPARTDAADGAQRGGAAGRAGPGAAGEPPACKPDGGAPAATAPGPGPAGPPAVAAALPLPLFRSVGGAAGGPLVPAFAPQWAAGDLHGRGAPPLRCWGGQASGAPPGAGQGTFEPAKLGWEGHGGPYAGPNAFGSDPCAWAGGAAAWLPSAASLPALEPGGPAQLAPWPLSMALPLTGGPGAPPHPAAMLAALHAQQARGAGGWGAPPPGGVPAAAPRLYGGCGGAAQGAWRAAAALQNGHVLAGAGGGAPAAAHDAAALAPGPPGPAGVAGTHAAGGGGGFEALGAVRAAGGGGQAAGPGPPPTVDPPGAGAPTRAHLELPRAASPGAGGAAEAEMFSHFLLASPCKAPAWPPGEPGAAPALPHCLDLT